LQNISARGEGGAHDAGPATGASGGDSYRDPFAPDFWSTQVEAPAANETTQKHIPEGAVDEAAKAEAQPAEPTVRPGPLAVTGTEAEQSELDAAFAVEAEPSDTEELLADLAPEVEKAASPDPKRAVEEAATVHEDA